jgi:hypothetical protein
MYIMGLNSDIAWQIHYEELHALLNENHILLRIYVNLRNLIESTPLL